MVSYSKGTNYQDKGIQKDYVDNVITIDTSQLNEVYGQDIAKMHQLQSAIADHQISSVFILNQCYSLIWFFIFFFINFIFFFKNI